MVEPSLVEDINFYKAKFDKEPPEKKLASLHHL